MKCVQFGGGYCNGLSSAGQPDEVASCGLSQMNCLLSIIAGGSDVCHLSVFLVHLPASLRVLSPLLGCDLPLSVLPRRPRGALRAGALPRPHRPVSSCSCSQESRECALTEKGGFSLLPPPGQTAVLQVRSETRVCGTAVGAASR